MLGITEKARSGPGSLYKAERLKYRRTLTGKLYILMPLLTLFAAYYLSLSYGVVNSYNWWYILFLPGMVTLLACLMGQKDKKLKNRAVLTLPFSPARVWDAKILVGITGIFKANLLLSLVTLTIWNIVLPLLGIPRVIPLSWAQGLTALFLMTLTMLWQLPLCLWLNQKTGFFPTLIINMALSTVGVAAAVTDWWLLCPYAILPRLMCPVLGILPNNLLPTPESPGFSPELLEKGSIFPGVLVSLLLFGLLWFLSRRWYEKKGAETV